MEFTDGVLSEVLKANEAAVVDVSYFSIHLYDLC